MPANGTVRRWPRRSVCTARSRRRGRAACRPTTGGAWPSRAMSSSVARRLRHTLGEGAPARERLPSAGTNSSTSMSLVPRGSACSRPAPPPLRTRAGCARRGSARCRPRPARRGHVDASSRGKRSSLVAHRQRLGQAHHPIERAAGRVSSGLRRQAPRAGSSTWAAAVAAQQAAERGHGGLFAPPRRPRSWPARCPSRAASPSGEAQAVARIRCLGQRSHRRHGTRETYRAGDSPELVQCVLEPAHQPLEVGHLVAVGHQPEVHRCRSSSSP